MPQTFTKIIDWAPIDGLWSIEPDSLIYQGPYDVVNRVVRDPFGIVASGVRFDGGKIRTKIRLRTNEGAGRILIGYGSRPNRWLAVGIGGLAAAYVISEYVQDTGWRVLEGTGWISNLEADRDYAVEVGLEGQQLRLHVDGIKIIDHILSKPPVREQVGLIAWGDEPVHFGPVEIATQALSAFVVMQFSGQFNELYEDVIQPVCADLGIEAYRASDIYRPGVILQDIIQGLTESHVIIAEITPANPNVCYELGYSHALQKPTILLADRETTKLPFDISGYRVIFYDNTIRGKSSVESELRQHLNNILGS